MLSAEEITELHRVRKTNRSDVINQMLAIRHAYNGDVIVPLPEMDREEQVSVANLISSGIDQLAARIASTRPVMQWPSLRPGVRAADRKAMTRKVAASGWWDHNRLPIKLRYRARHFIGYGSSPVLIRPGPGGSLPTWEVVNPLQVFAAPVDQPDQVRPYDSIIERERSREWLMARGYGDVLRRLNDSPVSMHHPDDRFVILEFCSPDQWSMVIAGRRSYNQTGTSIYGETSVMLHDTVNPINECSVVLPMRVSLDRQHGQFDQILPMYQMQSRLAALEVTAVEKGIFPDTFLESRAGEVARVVDGPYDGRSGKINVVAGGTIRELQSNPGYQTNPTIDRLERAQRLTAGIPSDIGGESGSNIRTGRRGDAVLAAVVDMPIMEAQELLAASLEEENHLAASWEKALHGSATREVFVNGMGSKQHQRYVPNEVFDTTKSIVSYPAVGTDLNGLVISIGQRVGIGLMSKHTGMLLDPLVDDPEAERDRVQAEGLEAALLSGLQAQAQSGQLPPSDVARIADLVRSDKMELAEAVTQAQAEAQERQAAQAPPGSPETQPGLALPGACAEQPTEAIGAPPQSAQNLSQLFTALRRPSMTTPAEQGAPLGG
jgi:hypothetical protein